jgi:hypothetical protein
MCLRCAVDDSPKYWNSWLSLDELWYNSSLHTALGCSPFKVLYGYEANFGVFLFASDHTPSEVVNPVWEREIQMTALKDQLAHITTVGIS